MAHMLDNEFICVCTPARDTTIKTAEADYFPLLMKTKQKFNILGDTFSFSQKEKGVFTLMLKQVVTFVITLKQKMTYSVLDVFRRSRYR